MSIVQQLLIATAMVAAIILMGWGLIRMGKATERDLRQAALRQDAHMRSCWRNPRCRHPDHDPTGISGED